MTSGFLCVSHSELSSLNIKFSPNDDKTWGLGKKMYAEGEGGGGSYLQYKAQGLLRALSFLLLRKDT